MATLLATGTQTAVIDTEHSLATVSTSSVVMLYVDTANLSTGDVLVLRVKTLVLNGGTTRLCQEAVYANPQAIPIKYSDPLITDQEAVFTLEQTDGTGRAFPWKVVSP